MSLPQSAHNALARDRILQLVRAALQQPVADRRAFLERECANDLPLLRHVERLLGEVWQATAGFGQREASEQSSMENPRDIRRDFAAAAFESGLQGRRNGSGKNWAQGGAVLDEPPEALLRPGGRIGPYRLLKTVGKGNSGTVFLAEREEEPHQIVAIKLLAQPFLAPVELERFEQICRQLALLDCPAIARLLGYGVEDGRSYLVMEYVEGDPLDIYCDRHELNVTRRLLLFLSVLRGMAYAHSRLVLHGNLKPDHILVTPAGKIKILDFGVSLLTGSRCVCPEQAAAVPFAYMAPEHVLGEPLTVASDTYSLSVILYQLLSGHLPRLKPPRRAEPVAPGEPSGREATLPVESLIENICGGAPEPPSEAVLCVEEVATALEGLAVKLTPESVSRPREGTPERLRRRLQGDLDAIVAKGLSKEVGERYSSAAEMAADIERHLQHLPVGCARQDWRAAARKFFLRNRAAATVGIAALGTAAVVTLLAFGVSRAAAVRAATLESQLVQFHTFLERVISAREIAVEGTPQPPAIDEEMVRAAEQALSGMPDASGGTFSQERRAALLLRLGDLRRPWDGWGDSVRARGDYELALRLAGKASGDGRKGSADARLAWAMSLARLGELEAAAGNRARAWDHYQRSLAALKSLTESEPRNLEARRRLAACYRIIGEDLLANGEVAGSLWRTPGEPLSLALSELDAVLAQDAGHIRARWEAAAIGRLLAVTAAAGGEYSKTLRALREALAVLAPLTPSDRNQSGTLWWRAVLECDLARNLVEGAQGAIQAMELAGSAEQLLERLAMRPDWLQAATAQRARLLTLRGGLHLRDGRMENALRDLNQARELLVAADPKGTLSGDQAELGLVRADALALVGRSGEALSEASSALHILAVLAAGGDSNGAWNERLARALLETRVLTLRDPRRAIRHARLAVELNKGRNPAYYATLAEALHAAGDRLEAAQTAALALRLLPPERPGEPAYPLRARLERGMGAGRQ